MTRLALTLLVLAALAVPAVASAASPDQMLQDFERHASLTSHYSTADLNRALADNHLAAEVGKAQAVAFKQAVAQDLAARSPSPMPLHGASPAGLRSETLLEKIGIAAMVFGIVICLFVIGWGIIPRRRSRTALNL